MKQRKRTTQDPGTIGKCNRILEKVEKYLSRSEDPSIEGLCLFVGVSRNESSAVSDEELSAFKKEHPDLTLQVNDLVKKRWRQNNSVRTA